MATSTDERLDRIDGTLRALQTYLQEFRTELIQRLDLVDQQANLNYTSLSVRLSHEHFAQGHIAHDLLQRVEALELQIAKLTTPTA